MRIEYSPKPGVLPVVKLESGGRIIDTLVPASVWTRSTEDALTAEGNAGHSDSPLGQLATSYCLHSTAVSLRSPRWSLAIFTS